MNKPSIQFIQVNDNATKLKAICHTVQSYFERKEPCLIIVPNLESAEYVNQLLWKYPEHSFIPHEVADHPTKELVVITIKKENPNLAKVILNLCPEAVPNFKEFNLIYEFWDETHPAKAEFSVQRRAFYEKNECFIH